MSKYINILVPIAMIFIAVGTSCSKTNAEDLTPVVEEDTTIVCAPEGMYATEVKPIMDAHCVTCHAPGNSVDYIPLDTHMDLVSNSTNLMASISQDGTALAMPQGASKLSDCDIQTVQKWVDGGMLDN